MHGSVHPREVGAPHGPRVALDGVRKKQLLDHDIIRLAGCVPQPPDSVVSHVGLASAGQQLSGGEAIWSAVICLRWSSAWVVSDICYTTLHPKGSVH